LKEELFFGRKEDAKTFIKERQRLKEIERI